MTGEHWYYCGADVDNEKCHGPVSLERLAELIRTAQLPYDVLVSTTSTPGAGWEEADRVPRILDAIPLDRERLMREYLACGEAPDGEENWAWASARMFSLLGSVPELAWLLIIEMIDRAPSDQSLGFLAAGPLEDLLSSDGPDFIGRVEERALQNAKFKRALGMLHRLGMTDDVWSRVQAAALDRSPRG